MFNGCCAEPSLEELFGDVAMQLLMRRDGVTEGDVRALLWKAKGARAAALDGTTCGPRTDVYAGQTSDQRDLRPNRLTSQGLCP